MASFPRSPSLHTESLGMRPRTWEWDQEHGNETSNNYILAVLCIIGNTHIQTHTKQTHILTYMGFPHGTNMTICILIWMFFTGFLLTFSTNIASYPGHKGRGKCPFLPPTWPVFIACSTWLVVYTTSAINNDQNSTCILFVIAYKVYLISCEQTGWVLLTLKPCLHEALTRIPIQIQLTRASMCKQIGGVALV